VVSFTVPLAIGSALLAVIGIVAMWMYQTGTALRGLTAKVPPLRWGYKVLVEKYYLDWLYEDVIVATLKGPVARAMYWLNMMVIDKIVVGAGVTAKIVGRFVYRYVDQDVVDRIVNTSGHASEGTGQFLRRSQSGKVQEYASLLFGSAVVFVICLVLVIQLSA
jgi:NADH-quinone oxidoreductase subunit L